MVVFDCMRLQPMGFAQLSGLFGLYQTPTLAQASMVPFELHEPSVKATMFRGGLVLVSHLVGSRDRLEGAVKMRKFLWISPWDWRFWSKSLTLSGGPIACFCADILSSRVVVSFSRWSGSWGLNFGDMSCRRRVASFRHEFGWGHPLLRYSVHGGHPQLFASLCVGCSYWFSWVSRLAMVCCRWEFSL